MITYSPAESPGASSSSRSGGWWSVSLGGPDGTVGVYSFTIVASLPRSADFWKESGRVLRFADAGPEARAGVDGARARVRAGGRRRALRREPLHGPEDRDLGQRPRHGFGPRLRARLRPIDAARKQRRPGRCDF